MFFTGADLTLDLSHTNIRFMPLEWALRSGPEHTRVRRLFLHGNPQLVFPPAAVANADSNSSDSDKGTASLRYFSLLGRELRLPNTRTVAVIGKVGSGKTTLTHVGMEQQSVVLPGRSGWWWYSRSDLA